VNTSIWSSNTGITYEVWTPVYYLLILVQQHMKSEHQYMIFYYWHNIWRHCSHCCLVRDSSAIRRLFSTCCSHGTSESSTYGKQRICPPTLGQHILAQQHMKCEHQYMIFYYWHNIWRVNTSILFSNTGTTTYEVWTAIYYLLILAQQHMKSEHQHMIF
jgi:hypothetical protein